MNLVFSLLACVALSFAYKMDCGTGKSFNVAEAQSTTPSVTTCCRDFVATCSMPSATNQEIFVCPFGQYVRNEDLDVINPTKASCCTELVDFSCSEYSQTQQGFKSFQCPGNTVFNGAAGRTKPVEGKEAETCCKSFSPDCGHIDATNTIFDDGANGGGYHLYDCPAGKTFDGTELFNAIVTEAVCCMDFSATCGFDSGSILDQKMFVCPSGKTYNSNNGKDPASDANCCVDFTPKCSRFTAAGTIFKCPAGKTGVSNFYEKTGTPTESSCCTEATCESVRQPNCADLHANKGDICGAGKERDATKDADVPLEDKKVLKIACCKFLSTTTPTLESMGERFVPVTALAAALLLL